MGATSFKRSQITAFEKYRSLLVGNPAKPPGILGVAGYVLGGFADGVASVTSEKLDFSTETVSSTTSLASPARIAAAGMSNRDVAGYAMGGDDRSASSPFTNQVDKFAFPADTRTTLGTGLSAGRRGLAGMSNPEVAGYAAGGQDNATGTILRISTVDKFAFPGDSRTTLGTGLSSARRFPSGMSDYGVAGYVAGGEASGGTVSTVDKFAFPGDTRTTLATGLSVAREASAGLSNTAVAGYIAGGGSTDTDIIDKFAFPSDTRTTLAATLSAVTEFAGAMSNPTAAGYVAGGGGFNTSARTDKIDKLDFSSETVSTLGNTLSADRTVGAGFQNA